MSLPVDLFFTQTDCHCDEEAGHDPDCDFANECEAFGLMSPRKLASQSPVPDQAQMDEDLMTPSSTRVRFHEFMKVVLIPTKEEFKKANCDLWWKRNDFMSFQKNATSELRLFSMIQNVNIQEAKHLLYQPQPEEMNADQQDCKVTETVQDVHKMMEDAQEDPFYDMSQTNHIFRGRTESEESVDEKRENRKPAADTALSIEMKPPGLPLPEEVHEPLNFCVPISDPVPASNNFRMSKYRNTIASAGILAAMGLFSFAAPILGFYFLSSQR